MRNVKSILIPTGFTERTWKALRYALRLYRDEKCIFYLLQSDTPDNQSHTIRNNGFRATNGDSKLQDFFLKLNATGGGQGHGFITVQENGNFVSNVRSLVASKEIDLIIMSACAGTEKEYHWVDSQTWDVITKTGCNVLVVPCEGEYRPIKEIAFATDYNLFYTNTLLEYLSGIQRITGAGMCVLESTSTGNGLLDNQQTNKTFLFSYLNETLPFKANAIGKCRENTVEAVENSILGKDIGLLVLEAKNVILLQQLLQTTTRMPRSFSELPLWILHE